MKPNKIKLKEWQQKWIQRNEGVAVIEDAYYVNDKVKSTMHYDSRKMEVISEGGINYFFMVPFNVRANNE